MSFSRIGERNLHHKSTYKNKKQRQEINHSTHLVQSNSYRKPMAATMRHKKHGSNRSCSWNWKLQVILGALLTGGIVQAFTAVKTTTVTTTTSRSATLVLHMALTPVGPFCPFRSSAAIAMDPPMNALNSAAAGTATSGPGGGFAMEMSRIQLDMQIGQMPDPQRLLKVADDMESAVDQWESLIRRLQQSRDFQTREYAKLTQAHLASHGVTVESIASMMKWQSGCLRALATNQPPPLPPPDMDLQKMVRDAQDAAEKGTKPPSLTAMQAAQSITASPFAPDSFASDTMIQMEYDALVRDHSSLIEFGANYDDFDPLGKLAYLDQIETVEDRWNVFFLRFQLMGTLNVEYKQQCDAFLASMNLKEDQYRDLLKQCHDIMRKDAQRERDVPRPSL